MNTRKKIITALAVCLISFILVFFSFIVSSFIDINLDGTSLNIATFVGMVICMICILISISSIFILKRDEQLFYLDYDKLKDLLLENEKKSKQLDEHINLIGQHEAVNVVHRLKNAKASKPKQTRKPRTPKPKITPDTNPVTDNITLTEKPDDQV